MMRWILVAAMASLSSACVIEECESDFDGALASALDDCIEECGSTACIESCIDAWVDDHDRPTPDWRDDAHGSPDLGSDDGGAGGDDAGTGDQDAGSGGGDAGGGTSGDDAGTSGSDTGGGGTTPDDECTFTADCDAGICVDGICAVECEVDRDCRAGEACESGLCEFADLPAVGCQDSSECSGDDVCIDAECRAACTCEADCIEGTRCLFGGCI